MGDVSARKDEHCYVCGLLYEDGTLHCYVCGNDAEYERPEVGDRAQSFVPVHNEWCDGFGPSPGSACCAAAALPSKTGSLLGEAMDPWMDTARMYANNADYWRERALRAERLSIQRLWWAATRWVRNHRG